LSRPAIRIFNIKEFYIMAWDASTPFRTGVPTIRKLLVVVCRLLAFFSPRIKEHLDPTRHVYVDDLQAACDAFMDNVPLPPRNE